MNGDGTKRLTQVRDLQPSSDSEKASYEHAKNGENEDPQSDRQTAAESTSANVNHNDRMCVCMNEKKNGLGEVEKQAQPEEGIRRIVVGLYRRGLVFDGNSCCVVTLHRLFQALANPKFG